MTRKLFVSQHQLGSKKLSSRAQAEKNRRFVEPGVMAGCGYNAGS
jgi:hypothetical protein